MILKIQYRFQDNPVTEFETSDPEILIGRATDSNIELNLAPDVKVSRVHARLTYKDNGWWIEDLRSTHGTLRNGKLITAKTRLSPGDTLKLGDTTLSLAFEYPQIEEGLINTELAVHETLPPEGLSERKRVGTLARLSMLTHEKQGQALLDEIVHEVLLMFPAAQHASIVLYRDKEQLPIAFSPQDQSHVSLTLAQRCINSRTAFRWERSVDSNTSKQIPSLRNTTAALYAPIIYNWRVRGVLNVDTLALNIRFSEMDLKILSDAATTLGRAIKTSSDNLRDIPSVFISYSHEDTEYIRKLANDLRRRQVSVWYDERLHPGKNWQEQLAEAINAVDVFALVMSPSSVTSPYVRWEIAQAVSKGKRIIPLMYQTCEIPPDLINIQYIKLGENYENSLTELVNELGDMMDAKRTP